MLLKLQNIGKIYDSNDILTIGIRGINLELDYNEFVTIEGESGSGKSTLLNVIGANDSYEEGELYFNGCETSHYSESDWEKYREKNIATIFQDFNIIENLTVLENVELALLRVEDKKERRRIAENLIAKVGLDGQKNRRGSKLSGGEKQRTVIARALAKDSPIILADEPTGNLDVKASREVAALLKAVSKDKLVIVVTHNPEFFKQYATRRIRIYDGKISEDKIIQKPPQYAPINDDTAVIKRRGQDLKNTLHIGLLNYKSRPKFTAMMSFALLVCAVTLFLILTIFSDSFIQPVTQTLDSISVEGKVIISSSQADITQDGLDYIAGETGAGYILIDQDLSSFTVSVPKQAGMTSSYTVNCLYAPYTYNLKAGEAVLVLPGSASGDSNYIVAALKNAGAGLEDITVKTALSAEAACLYLSYDDITDNGVKIQAINSTMKMGEDSITVYTFERNEELETGCINLVNCNYYDVKSKTIVFSVKSGKAFSVADDSLVNEDIGGIIVQMSAEDYDGIFAAQTAEASLSCLYFSSDEAAQKAINKLPEGYVGLLSSSKIYVTGAGEVFAENVLCYIALIAASLVFAALISVIFMRSVKIYQNDFTVYRTLGISGKISSRSLYVQMALIFLPTLVLLPLVSFIATVIPAIGTPFITFGNYIFIEVMLLFIVEFVAYGFNKSIKGQSIRKSLRRGSK